MQRREFLKKSAQVGLGAALYPVISKADYDSLKDLKKLQFSRKPKWLWKKPMSPKHSVIFKPPREYDDNRTAAVATVILLDNNCLATSFSYDIPISDAIQMDPQRPVYVSCDGGMKWKKKEDLESLGLYKGDPNGIDWPSKPLRLGNGTLLMTGIYGWENFPAEKRGELEAQGYYVWESHPGTVSASYRAWQRMSTDNGKTWEISEVKLPKKMGLMCFYNGEGIILDDGAYVRSSYGYIQGDNNGACLILKTYDGINWEVYTTAYNNPPNPRGYTEPTISQASNGDLISIMRTGDQRTLYITRSTDGGVTWSEPRDSGLRGSTPWSVRSSEGLLVAVFGRRGHGAFPRTGIWCGISEDNGQSWKQFELIDRGAELVTANGMAVPLPDGSVYVVYSFAWGKAIGGTRFHPRYFIG